MEPAALPTATAVSPPPPKLQIDRFADGDLVCLKLAGTIDEAFEGKRLADSVKSGTLILDLGDIRESARVILNGKEIATAWSLPFRVRLNSSQFKPGRNVLELDVTNLAANRIRYMDQNKLPWKIMRDSNIVNINYRPFDASSWPFTPSGLLGPITLTPLANISP